MLKFAAFQVQSAVLIPKNASPARVRRIARRHEFNYEVRPGFLYVKSRAISSRTNDNYDEFPAEEIAKGYKTFIGKPVFVNHVNDNHRRMRGVIIDVVLHEDTLADGSPDTWAEVLMEIDAINFPKLAKAILEKRIDRTSMGVDVEYSICSACGNKATTPAEYCVHVPRMKGKKIRKRDPETNELTEHLIRETCYGLAFFENSVLVEPPADPTAHFLGVDDSGVKDQGLAKAARKISSQISVRREDLEFTPPDTMAVLRETMHSRGRTADLHDSEIHGEDEYQRQVNDPTNWQDLQGLTNLPQRFHKDGPEDPRWKRFNPRQLTFHPDHAREQGPVEFKDEEDLDQRTGPFTPLRQSLNSLTEHFANARYPEENECANCRQPIRESSDHNVPWVHAHSSNSYCDVSQPSDATLMAGAPHERTEAEPRGEKECEEPYCQDNKFPEGWHTNAEHIDPAHLDPHSDASRDAERALRDVFGDGHDAKWLLDQQHIGPTKYSSLMQAFASLDDNPFNHTFKGSETSPCHCGEPESEHPHPTAGQWARCSTCKRDMSHGIHEQGRYDHLKHQESLPPGHSQMMMEHLFGEYGQDYGVENPAPSKHDIEKNMTEQMKDLGGPDADWLLSQQKDGPTKYSSLTQHFAGMDDLNYTPPEPPKQHSDIHQMLHEHMRYYHGYRHKDLEGTIDRLQRESQGKDDSLMGRMQNLRSGFERIDLLHRLHEHEHDGDLTKPHTPSINTGLPPHDHSHPNDPFRVQVRDANWYQWKGEAHDSADSKSPMLHRQPFDPEPVTHDPRKYPEGQQKEKSFVKEWLHPERTDAQPNRLITKRDHEITDEDYDSPLGSGALTTRDDLHRHVDHGEESLQRLEKCPHVYPDTHEARSFPGEGEASQCKGCGNEISLHATTRPSDIGKPTEQAEKARTKQFTDRMKDSEPFWPLKQSLNSLTRHFASKQDAPSVSGVVLKAADTGRILMIQRSNQDESDPARGTWEFPGGHHEDGDVTSLHAGIREWEEEVGQPFPAGGSVSHTWRSSNGIYQGHVVVIPEESAVTLKDGRVTVNPDDPDGDDHEQAAWWDPKHAEQNPALRREVKKAPWSDLRKAAGRHSAPETTEQWHECDQGHHHWGTEGAVGALIRHTDDKGTTKYLLQHRAPWVQEGGTWGIPAGALHKDEDPIAGAKRESAEELGSLPELHHVHTHTDDHGGWAFHTHVFDTPHQWEPSPTDNETGEGGFKWATSEEMKSLPLHSGFAASFPHLEKVPTAKTARHRRRIRHHHHRSVTSHPMYRGGGWVGGWGYGWTTGHAGYCCEAACGGGGGDIGGGDMGGDGGGMSAEGSKASDRITLYRGEGTHSRESYYPKSGPDAHAGAWWTSNLESAQGYAAKTTEGKVYRLDVHEGEAAPTGAPGNYMVHDPEVRARRVLHAEAKTAAIWDDPEKHQKAIEEGKARTAEYERRHPRKPDGSLIQVGQRDVWPVRVVAHDRETGKILGHVGGRAQKDGEQVSRLQWPHRLCPAHIKALGAQVDAHNEKSTRHPHRYSITQDTWPLDPTDRGDISSCDACTISMVNDAFQKQANHPEIPFTDADRDFVRKVMDSHAERLEKWQQDEKRVVNTSDPVDLRQHMIDSHDFDDSDFWRNTHGDHPALGETPNVDRPLTHSEIHALHEHDHASGDYAGTTMGSSHFHTATLRKQADEDQCPYCSGDSLMEGGVYTCEDQHQWTPSDPAAQRYHGDGPQAGQIQPLPKTSGLAKTAMDAPYCLACGEDIKVNPNKYLQFGERKGEPVPNDGWHHHDGMKRDHPAIPHDGRSGDDQRTADRAGLDQARMHMRDRMTKAFEERDLGRRVDESVGIYTCPECKGLPNMSKYDSTAPDVDCEHCGGLGKVGPGVRREAAAGDTNSKGMTRHDVLASEVQIGDFLDISGKVRVHNTNVRGTRATLAYKVRGSKAPGVHVRNHDDVISVWRKAPVKKEATWIGDHFDEPTLFWRAPKTKKWEVHISNWTPGRDLRDGYGAKPTQRVTLHHADSMAPVHPDNAATMGPRGGWEYHPEHGGYDGQNSWGEGTPSIPAHVHNQVLKAQAEVDKHAENHASLYGGVAQQQDIRDDQRKVEREHADGDKGKQMFRNLLNSAGQTTCHHCDGEGNTERGPNTCGMCDGRGFLKSGRRTTAAFIEKGKAVWAKPAGQHPSDGAIPHEDGPFHLTRHPETRAHQLVDSKNRLIWSMPGHDGTYDEHHAPSHLAETFHELNQAGGHHSPLPYKTNDYVHLPEPERGNVGKELFDRERGLGKHAPSFPHSTDDPRQAELEARPAPRKHTPDDYSPEDEWHGPYEVVQHPETSKYHVVDNQGRHADHWARARKGHDDRIAAEDARDTVDRRTQSKEQAKQMGEAMFEGFAQTVDPGSTSESRQSDRHSRNMSELMGRYEGGVHHPLTPGKFGADDDEKPGDGEGRPYYEVKDPGGSGYTARDYGGHRVHIHHEGHPHPIDEVEPNGGEPGGWSGPGSKPVGFGHEELHHELQHWVHGDPSEPEEERYAPGKDYARAMPDIERWQKRKGYKG